MPVCVLSDDRVAVLRTCVWSFLLWGTLSLSPTRRRIDVAAYGSKADACVFIKLILFYLSSKHDMTKGKTKQQLQEQ